MLRKREEPLRVLFYGNRQAGMIALLTVAAMGHEIIEVWDDEGVGLPGPITATKTISRELPRGRQGDLFLCAHGWRVVPDHVLRGFRYKVNMHPFLDTCPGLNPVERAIELNVTEAALFAHHMTETIDDGDVLTYTKTPMPDKPTVERVYNVLYPLYADVARSVLACISGR